MSETAQLCDFTECENTDRHLWPETSPVDAPEEKLFVTSAGGIGINIGGHVIVRPLREWHRLAASQPDREAVARAIMMLRAASRLIASDGPAFGICIAEECEAAANALSLLSGAGSGADTKSDGGCNCSWGCVEADNCRRKLGPLPDWKQDQSETSRIKPRPSDPSPGPVKPAPIADSSEAGTGGIVAVTQPFEKYPQLAAHIVRLANTPTAFSLNEWNDFLAALNAALSAPVGEPEGLPFGIIDPKYASFYTVARLTAWSYGYAIAMHGSFTRDLDLIAIPWTDAAVTPEKLIHQIQYRTGCTPVKPNASIREHGRIVWTLSFPEFDCPRFVDFSIIPPAPAVGPDVREALEESSQTLEYLRREARTWGKIFSVNVDHVLDKNRKALSALTRPLGGFVQGSIARKQSTDSALQAQGDER